MSETNSIAFSQVCPHCVETPNGWEFCEAHLASLKRERDQKNSASSPAVSPVPPTAWSPENVEMARLFHDVYEEEAARLGWQSQTPVSFEELPEANRLTMLHTVARVRSRIAKTVYSELIEQINELESSAPPVALVSGDRVEVIQYLDTDLGSAHEYVGKRGTVSKVDEKLSFIEVEIDDGDGETYLYPEELKLLSPISKSTAGAPSVGELEWVEGETEWGKTWGAGCWLIEMHKGNTDVFYLGTDEDAFAFRNSLDAAKSLANSLQRILSGAAEEGNK